MWTITDKLPVNRQYSPPRPIPRTLKVGRPDISGCAPPKARKFRRPKRPAYPRALRAAISGTRNQSARPEEYRKMRTLADKLSVNLRYSAHPLPLGGEGRVRGRFSAFADSSRSLHLASACHRRRNARGLGRLKSLAHPRAFPPASSGTRNTEHATGFNCQRTQEKSLRPRKKMMVWKQTSCGPAP